jgi:hypothetical protein
MDRLSRREFLCSLVAATSLLMVDFSFAPGAARPALSEVLRNELGAFSGDRHFNQMHIELLGKKREGARRNYRTAIKAEKIDIIIVGGGIAGLDTAYYLLTDPEIREKGAVVRLFELDDEVGGTAKEYAWEGLPYTNSAAYFYVMEKEDPIMELYQDLGVTDEMIEPSSTDKESMLIGNKPWFNIFSRGRGAGFESETEALRASAKFFSSFNRENLFPSVPWEAGGAYSREEFMHLDRMSFGELLEGKAMPKGLRPPQFPMLFREFAENYCYSSFGCSSYAVSAWQGLNWFASEFAEGGVAVLPGGNGRITTRLREKIASLDRNCIRTSLPVVDVTCDPTTGKKRVTVAQGHDMRKGSYETYDASYVVMACPLAVSRRIITGELPARLRESLASLRYSGYLVGNVFVHGTLKDECWDMYCLDDYKLLGKQGESFYRKKAFMDLINATWSVTRSPTGSHGGARLDRSVFTLYSPQPFPDQRQALLRDDYCDTMKERMKKELLARLEPQGLKKQAIAGIRLARWGHAMLQATPGLCSSGILTDL